VETERLAAHKKNAARLGAHNGVDGPNQNPQKNREHLSQERRRWAIECRDSLDPYQLRNILEHNGEQYLENDFSMKKQRGQKAVVNLRLEVGDLAQQVIVFAENPLVNASMPRTISTRARCRLSAGTSSVGRWAGL
jgi:hypothetical protein